MEEKLGSVIIAPEVLVTIARLTALSVPGVARMSPGLAGVDRFLKRGAARGGAKIEVEEGIVSVALHIIAEPNVNMYQLGQQLQAEVTRAIHDMVGMPVREVNVYIEGVEAPSPLAPKSRGERGGGKEGRG